MVEHFPPRYSQMLFQLDIHANLIEYEVLRLGVTGSVKQCAVLDFSGGRFCCAVRLGRVADESNESSGTFLRDIDGHQYRVNGGGSHVVEVSERRRIPHDVWDGFLRSILCESHGAGIFRFIQYSEENEFMRS